jgi:uncharacterized membrane protein
MKLKVGDLLGGTWATIVGDRIHAVGALVVLTAVGVLTDTLGNGALIIASATNLVGAWFVTRTFMERESLVGDRAVGFGSVFALSLLSGIGTVLGLLLLVVPGILLLVRWIAALPILLAGEAGATDALRQSWDLTRGNVSTILISGLVVFAPLVMVIFAMVALGFEAGVADTGGATTETGLLEGMLTNFGISASTVAGWYLALTVYRALVGDHRRLSEVFA